MGMRLFQYEAQLKCSSACGLEKASRGTPADHLAVVGLPKRKRKPSEKGLELQAEKGRRPFTKNKSSRKTSKTKNKTGEGRDPYPFEDDVTDEFTSNWVLAYDAEEHGFSGNPNLKVQNLKCS
ncbi:hypothetical protein ACLOJK_003692 [Asimina triloba]